MEVTIEPSRMDLGKIDPIKAIDFWFEVTNHTDKTLDFQTWASCGCTTPQIIPSKVEAGQKAKLKAQFNPTGKTGLQEKMLGVHYFVDGNKKSVGTTFIAMI